MYKRRGFTLVELLVVIAIIALLMSILMPALAKVKKQAKAVACMSNLSEWGKIFVMYTGDSDGYFMGGWSTPDPRESWPYALRSYVDIRQKDSLGICPRAGWNGLKLKSITDMQGSTLYPWGGPAPIFAFLGGLVGDCGSYGTNSLIYNAPSGSGGVDTNYWRRSDVPNAGIIPVLVDSTWITSYPWHTDPPPEFEGATVWSGVPGVRGMGTFCINRHDGAINILFMDWSVRKVRLKRLWTLKWARHFDVNGPWTEAGGVMPQDWRNEGSGWLAPFPY